MGLLANPTYFQSENLIVHPAIAAKAPTIAAACLRHGVRRLALFGSGVREQDFEPGRSDADFLVEFRDDQPWDLATWTALQDELQRILGVSVDLLERKTLEASRNYIRRRRILDEAETVYVA